jgi:hypothetical protein
MHLGNPELVRTCEVRMLMLTRMYCRMLAEGMLLSQGWAIAGVMRLASGAQRSYLALLLNGNDC